MSCFSSSFTTTSECRERGVPFRLIFLLCLVFLCITLPSRPVAWLVRYCVWECFMSNSSSFPLSWRPGISQHLHWIPKIRTRGRRKALLLIAVTLLKLTNTLGCKSYSSEVMCGFCIQMFSPPPSPSIIFHCMMMKNLARSFYTLAKSRVFHRVGP